MNKKCHHDCLDDAFACPKCNTGFMKTFPTAKVLPDQYTIEPHGVNDNLVLFKGRDDNNHGLNILTLSDIDPKFDVYQIAHLLNMAIPKVIKETYIPWTIDTVPVPLSIIIKDKPKSIKTVTEFDEDGVHITGTEIVADEFTLDGGKVYTKKIFVNMSLTYKTLLDNCLQYPSKLPCGVLK